MKLKISLNENSIDNAILQLKTYIDEIESKRDEIMRRLAEIGAEEARRVFTQAGADITVTTEKTENGYKIVAAGSQVAFVEFGAGDAAGMGFDYLPDGIDIYPGSWSGSELGKHQYSNTGKWTYQGEEYTEIQPARAMFSAAELMREKIGEIAKEVFSNG